MCIRTATKASALCMIPAVVAFAAAGLSVQQPKVFLGALGLALAASGYVAFRSYARTGKVDGANAVEEVEVAAGILCALSFMFSFWCGLAFQAGLGILPAGVIVAVSTALLAAFTLTFVRRVINRNVPWLDHLVQRFFPAGGAGVSERAV